MKSANITYPLPLRYLVVVVVTEGGACSVSLVCVDVECGVEPGPAVTCFQGTTVVKPVKGASVQVIWYSDP
eukprot:1159831-Pelagomonas_calceolata.AAC.5